MTIVLIIIGGAAMLTAIVSGVGATATSSDILTRVNERLPREHRISAMGSWNYQRAARLYPQLIPDGPLIRRLQLWRVLSFVSIAVVALCLVLAGRLTR